MTKRQPKKIHNSVSLFGKSGQVGRPDQGSPWGGASSKSSLIAGLDEIRPDKSVGFVILGAGVFFTLVGLDIIPSTAYKLPPHYLLAALGASFLLTGFSVFLKSFGIMMDSPLHLILRFCGTVAFLVPIHWVIFGDNAFPLSVKIIIGFFTLFIIGILSIGFFMLRFNPNKIQAMVLQNPEIASTLGQDGDD